MRSISPIGCLFALACLPAANVAAQTSAPASRPALTVPSAVEIRRAIHDLNHPAVTRRRAAIRQLAEWGPLVFPELRRAAQDPNLEAALSARDLLGELESALLLGAHVRLEISKHAVAWNEPFSLTVIAENPTPGPVRAPWAAPATQPSTAPAMVEALQVAAMMDAADFFVVTGPDQKPLDLRVEPIDHDPDVYAAVDDRARGTSPSHEIQPGGQARLTIPLFNRGWARYPLLAKGTYQISFAYQPKWKDESWSAAGFGRVQGQPVEVTITQPAPPGLLKANAPLELRLERAGDAIEAIIVSHWDIPVYANLNLGGARVTHGRLEWHLIVMRQDNAEPVEIAAATTAPEFAPSHLKRIDPGARVSAGAVRTEMVSKRLTEVTKEHPGEYAIQARYIQLSTPIQLRDALTKLGKPHDITAHLFSGALTTGEMPVDSFLKPE